MSAMSAVQADTIDGIQGTDVGTQSDPVTSYDFTSHIQFGYGGWNLDNATVNIINAETGEAVAKSFDEATGTYSAMVDGETFYSAIYDDASNLTGKLASKVWPVGEPAGVKVLTDTNTVYESNGKPASCIMSTAYHRYSDDSTITPPAGAVTSDGFLDSAYPNPTMCDSAFQTHKRFKVSAQPASLTSGGIDMVFNVSDSANAEGAAQTRYMVLQKLNNYTGQHLSGFKIQVGTGVGASFTAIGAATTVELSDGAGEKTGGGDIWGAEDRAAFSAGLFGPADPPKHPDPGFFDNTNRAGFNDAENANKDEIASTGAMTSNYTTLFGGSKWLPAKYQPKGIFYDSDNNPDTDDQLVAWWGDNPNTTVEDYQWLKGDADNFAPVPVDTLNSYVDNSQYYIGGIEDTVNLGLTYAVDVGDLAPASGTAQFTLRMIPIADTNQYVPGYMEEGNQPPTELVLTGKGGSSFSAYDNTSLVAMILGFLGLGAWVARRKLSK